MRPLTLPEDVLRGVDEFNRGEYFEAHECWEDHWGIGPPAERELTLGLIKAAVALHHMKNGNVSGYEWQAEKAVGLLRKHADYWPELDALDLADEVESVGAQYRFHGTVDPATFPRIRLAGSTTPPEASSGPGPDS